MELILFGIGVLVGVLGALLLAKTFPSYFVAVENDVANTLKVTGSANSTLTVANTK